MNELSVRLIRYATLALVGVSLCGTANARRNVPVDTWQSAPASADGTGPAVGPSLVFDSSTTLASGSLPSWLTSLIIAPPISMGQIGEFPQVQQPHTGLPIADMWEFINTGDDGQLYGGQVALYPTSNVLKIDLNFAAPSCSGKTASLSINGLSYSASNPCSAGIDTPTFTGDDYNQSEFLFGLNKLGKVVLEDAVPAGWAPTSKTVVSAPEIDPSGWASELLLLVGFLTVLQSRRRAPRRCAAIIA